jgi:hypothetical protein
MGKKESDPKVIDVQPTEEQEHIDPEPQTQITEITPTVDHMDRVILAASKLEEYGKARNSVMNFIIKQSYPGDWVSHSMESVPKLDRSANLGSAGCERIANLLGIYELNWKRPVKEWSENRLHYTYLTEADFEFAGRRIHVMSRVGTRDTFWRVEYKWDDRQKKKLRVVKPLEDVREDYIEKASFRGCRKEGIRTLLGLRNVPLSKLAELGFNTEQVRYASFKTSQKTSDESGKVIGAQKSDGLNEYTLQVTDIGQEKQGKKGPFYVISDVGGDRFYLHAGSGSKRLGLLRGALLGDEKIVVRFKTVQNYKNIVEVVDGSGVTGD